MHRAYCTWRATVAAPGRGPSAETGIHGLSRPSFLVLLHGMLAPLRASARNAFDIGGAFERAALQPFDVCFRHSQPAGRIGDRMIESKTAVSPIAALRHQSLHGGFHP